MIWDYRTSRKAVTSTLAKGAINAGRGGIAAVVDIFVRAIETSEFERRLREFDDRFKTPDAVPAAGAETTWPYNL